MPPFLQSPAWERFQQSAGAQTERSQGQLFIARSFRFGHYWQSSRCQFESFELPSFADGATFVRLEPEDETSLGHIAAFATKSGLMLKPTLAMQPRQTLLLPIQRPFNEITAGFKQKHRYNLKVAERAGLTADTVSYNLDTSFERFWNLMQATAERQDFRTHPKEYYRLMLKALEPEGKAHLVFVRLGAQDLAALILITHDGTATYLHGASSQAHREAMAPYLMHATAIKLAQELGCHTYDFWGIDAHQVEGEWKPKEGAASAGTTRFKLGFGGQVLEYPGCWDLVLRPFWYTAYAKIRALRGGKRAFS